MTSTVDPWVVRAEEGAEDEALGMAFLRVLKLLKATDGEEFTLITAMRRDLRHPSLVKLFGRQRIASLERHGVAAIRTNHRVVRHSMTTTPSSPIRGVVWSVFPTTDQLARLIGDGAHDVTALVVSVLRMSAADVWLRGRPCQGEPSPGHVSGDPARLAKGAVGSDRRP